MWTSFTFCGIDLHIGRRRRQLWSWLCQIGWDLRCLHCWVSQNSNACIHGASRQMGRLQNFSKWFLHHAAVKAVPYQNRTSKDSQRSQPFHGSWMLMAYQGLSTLPVHLASSIGPQILDVNATWLYSKVGKKQIECMVLSCLLMYLLSHAFTLATRKWLRFNMDGKP